MGINNGTPSGGGSGCPNISLHNDQWFAFVAGSESITIDVLTSNCTTADGLQAAFYDACGVDGIACNSGSNGGAGIPLTLSYGAFVPGQTYYLMVDGFSGCVCNYEIDVVDGSVTPPPPTQPLQPDGPTQLCPGATAVYTIPDADGAGYYNWTAPAGSQINGGSNNMTFQAPNGTEVTITFGNTMNGSVCVRAGNACFPALQACLPVTVKPIPPTVLPPKILCSNSLPYAWEEEPGTFITQPGTYNLTSTPYTSYLGCDSIIKQTIIAKPPISVNAGNIYICEGECVEINNTTYCNSASNQAAIFQTTVGCDSIVNFNIVKIPALALIGLPQPIDCVNPSLILNSAGSTSPGSGVSYSWKNTGWSNLGTGTTQSVGTAGTYHLVIVNTQGTKTCRDTADVTVTSNTVPPGATVSGGNINCTNQSTTLMGSSATNGVSYIWTGPGITPANQFQQNPSVNVSGTYTLTVTNPINQCTSAASVTVMADQTPPTASATGGNILCLQPSVILTATTNIATPIFNWAGPGITPANQTIQNPSVTLSGTYTVTITNPINGCPATTTALVIQDIAVPTAGAGIDNTITCDLPNITLTGSGSTNGPNPVFTWTGPGITPANMNVQSPNISVPGQYILTVSNPVNNCFKKDTVVIGESVILPIATAGIDQTINCTNPMVTLNGVGSSVGSNYLVTWAGPGINATNINQYAPQVNVNGTYTIQIFNNLNGCSATDQIVVAINTAIPTANAGGNQILTCTTPNGIVLNGSGSPANVTYLWQGPGVGANNETQQTPTVTLSGTYTLEVTNPINGCKHTDVVQVSQDAGVPIANAGTDLTLNCTVSSVSINGAGSSNGANFTYQWSGPGINAGNSSIVSPSNLNTPGTYNLIVTNTTNNCINSDIVVILLDTIHPNANGGIDLILNCYNNTTDTLNAALSSTGNNYAILWSGPGINAGNQTSASPIINNQPGAYILTITNTDNTCFTTDQVQAILNITPPVSDAGIDKTIDCVITSTLIGGASSTGNNFTYEWTGPDLDSTNNTTPTLSVNLPGTFSLEVTNTINGCSATNDMIVNSDAIYPTATAGADGLLTCDNPTATLNGAGSSNGVGFNLIWSGSGITPANQNQVLPVVSTSGIYILSITNTVNSCNTKDTVFVSLNQDKPLASAGADVNLDCQTTSDLLDGGLSSTGATITYTWQGAGINAGNVNLQSPSVTEPGIYTLVVEDTENGCTADATVEVFKDVVLPIAIAGSDITLTCEFPDLAIDGSASSTGSLFGYIWQGPGIGTSNFDDQSPTVNESGTYTVIVTNSQNNCTATDLVFVGENKTLPLTAAGSDQVITCAELIAQLDGSLSQSGTNITYAWSGPGLLPNQATLATPNVNAIGTYTLVITNSDNGCENTDVVMVTENKILPFVNAGGNIVLTCANSTTGLPLNSAGSSTGSNYAYLWSGPGITPVTATQANPIVNVPGVYTLQITDSDNGCSDDATTEVLQDQNLPTAVAGQDQTINCAITQATLDGTNSIAPVGGSINFTWTGPGINSINQNDQQPIVTVSGVYTLTVVNPISLCQSSDNVTVLLDTQSPTATAIGGEITCQSQSFTINSTSSVPNSTYKWEGFGIVLATETLQNPSVEFGGTYTVTVTAPNGCTGTTTAVVTVDANVPQGNAEGTTLNCINEGISSVTGQVLSPPNATFSWSGPGVNNVAQLTVPVTQAGTYIFTINSPNGCKKEISRTVVEDYTLPTVFASVTEEIDCNTPEVTLSGAGTSTGPNFSYLWSTGTNGIVSGGNSLNPKVDKAGEYTLLVTDALNGCTAEANVEVEIDPLVPSGFNLNIRDILCFGQKSGALVIEGINGGTAPFQFTLTNPNGVPSNQYNGLGAGEYTLDLVDANGCQIDTVILISEPEQLIVELGSTIEVDLGQEADIKAIIAKDSLVGIETIIWNFPSAPDSSLTYTYLPLESYRHSITIVDENGCTATDFVDVIVKKPRNVYVGNIFNPESTDPSNSILMIQGNIDIKNIKRWSIYDRWGNAVFEITDVQPNDPAGAWSGNVRGQKGAPAVYVWVAEIEFIDGVTQLFKGDVALYR